MTYLENYKLYSSGDEVAPELHYWAGISSLSSLISRRVWFRQGKFTVYPNLYIILVGNPGTGKSIAMSVARGMVRDLGTIPITPSSVTKEQLTKTMGNADNECNKVFEYDGQVIPYSHQSIFASELTTLLGGAPKIMVDFLLNAWDQDTMEVETKNKGCDYIIGPFVTLLGCMTLGTASNLLKEEIINGGLARRCIFVMSKRGGGAVPIPVITPEQEAAKQRCINWGQELQHVKGEFKWSDEAREFFIHWYNVKYERSQTEKDDLIAGFLRSMDQLLLKLGMLISLSESKDLVLKKEHLEQGLKYLVKGEQDIMKVFAGVGKNEQAAIKVKILDYMTERPGPVTFGELSNTFFDDCNESTLREIIEHLKNIKRVKVQIAEGNKPSFVLTDPV